VRKIKRETERNVKREGGREREREREIELIIKITGNAVMPNLYLIKFKCCLF
jgi:hypothetical protein